jgi:hypothetical protein
VRKRRERHVACRVVGQLALAGAVVDDDRAQARTLDDGRLVAVERNADPQRSRAVQELARECYRERELPGLGGRVGGRRQLVLIVLSWPRIAPAWCAALWRLT